jgi:hypothetical protein
MAIYERSGKAVGVGMGEYNLLGSGCPPRQVVVIFDQESEQIDFGNRPTDLQGWVANPGSLVRQTP